MSQIRIAVIDDENEILSVLDKFLRREGYSVSTFANPLNALSQIKGNYDVILLDIMMPQMNGIEVLEKLREKEHNVKVIMMTAYSTLDKVLNSHRIGADDYIMKPFESLQAVKQKIESVLASKK